MSSRILGVFVSLIVAVVLAVFLVKQDPTSVVEADTDEQNNVSTAAKADDGSDAGKETAKPDSAVAATKDDSNKKSAYELAKADPNNPRVQSVMEAAKSGKYPERLDVAIAPKPFDKAAFEKDPQTYLQTIEPGRVYQTMPPKKDAPRLQMIGKNPTTVDSGHDVVLKVQALPGAPVSFFAQRGGIFRESTLNSITVQADEKGVAQVTFFANPGTVAIAPVVVGSPYLAGNAEIMVSVRPEQYSQKLQELEQKTANP